MNIVLVTGDDFIEEIVDNHIIAYDDHFGCRSTKDRDMYLAKTLSDISEHLVFFDTDTNSHLVLIDRTDSCVDMQPMYAILRVYVPSQFRNLGIKTQMVQEVCNMLKCIVVELEHKRFFYGDTIREKDDIPSRDKP